MVSDRTFVRELDLHSATVIATVMAQTVALDHYSSMVHELLMLFEVGLLIATCSAVDPMAL